MKRMKINLLYIFCLLALTCSVGRAEGQKDAVAYIKVGVTDPASNGKRQLTTGSGFLIDRRGHILTARHVIMAKEREEPGPRWIEVAIQDRSAATTPAQIVACESGNIDLCLIKISDAAVVRAGVSQVFAPSCAYLSAGDAVTAYGYPFGELNPVIQVPGEITGDLATELKYPSNVAIIPGMSGGPVLKGGKAVAVNTGAATGFPTMTFVQPLLYGQGLMARAGIPCGELQQNSVADCREKTVHLDKTQLSLNEGQPSSRQYNESLLPDSGCKISAVETVVKSANNSSGPEIRIVPDGVKATVSYTLTSGPFFDRYRGWLDCTLIVKQEPRT